MNILIFAGLSDQKLTSKLSPIAHLDFIEHIWLLRRKPLSHPKVHCISPQGFFHSIPVLSEVIRLWSAVSVCRANRIDWVVGIYLSPHFLLAIALKILLGKKIIFMLSEEPDFHKHNPLFKFFIRFADKVAVRGNRSKKQLAMMGIPQENIIIPANVYTFRQEGNRPDKKRDYDFVFAGDFIHEKRLDILLEVLKNVKKEGVSFRVLFIGDGPIKAKLKRWVEDFGLKENVTLAGRVDDIYPLLSDACTLILTSYSEGLPMVMIEAMDCGLPCIVPRIGDIEDVARDGYNALVVEPLNVSQYTQACLRLLKDTQLYQELSQNAKQLAREKEQEYSIAVISQKWASILTDNQNVQQKCSQPV